MIKAFKLMSPLSFNDSDDRNFDNGECDDNDENEELSENEECDSENENDDNEDENDDSESSENEVEIAIPSHIERVSCCCHRTNLIVDADVKKFFKDLKKNDKVGNKCKRLYQNSFAAVNRVWILQNKSSKFKDDVKATYGSVFKVGNETRWFYKTEALKNFFEKLDNGGGIVVMKSLFDRQVLKKPLKMLTAQQIEFLREYILVRIIN